VTEHGVAGGGQGTGSAGTATAPGQVAVPGPAQLVRQRPGPRPPLVIAWPAHPDRPGEPVPLRDRWCFLGVFLISVLVFISADTGRMIYDTKLGVDIDAAGFLARLWQLWDPLEWFGALQNQYIGYAIPMAPFYLLGQLARIPVWLIERLWMATLVTVGFAGVVRLARALGVGTDGTRLLAGAVYVLWPEVTIVIGSTSVSALPNLVLPWAILPLAGAVRGHRPPGRAVALSGLAIAAMSGVNAAVTGYALIMPALFILIEAHGRLRISLLAKWLVAVLAGTAWWLIPLLLQGKYSFNFLPYIEQSSTTFQTMSADAFLRGAGNWTAYLNLGAAWLPAGWSEVTTPLSIIASGLAAATGLYGLARRDMPVRRWLLTSVGLAAAVALSGYWGPLGSPLSGVVDSLFNGALAPLRSVYKLETVVGLAVALGCAHAVARWSRAELPVRAGRVPASAAIAPLAALALAGLAVPQLSGQILNAGSFSSVPAYWYQAADYLAAHSPRQTALVVPGDPHGQYDWGDPIDEPLEPLASSPWTERSQVPYGGAGSQAFLSAAEQAVDSGDAVPGLPAYLARAGIRYVVVRNDLSPTMLGYVSPQVVNETMALSGFERVTDFGPMISASPTYPEAEPARAGPEPSYPAVEVFQAVNPAWRPSSPVSVLPTASTVLVNGGPDSFLQLAGQGIVTTQPAVIAGDSAPVSPSLWAITDGQRRQDDDFSMPNQDFSFTYTATEANPPDSQLGGAGGPPRQLLPVPAAGHQTVAVLSGAAQVTASSYGSWLDQEPQYDPVNAFDGNPATAWAEGSPGTPVGQWIQVTFDHALDLPATIGIRLLDDNPRRSVATQVRVSTAAGSVTTSLAATSATQSVRVRPGPTGWLRVTITGATVPLAGGPGAGFTSVDIPGVSVTRYLEPAEDPAGTAAPSVAYSFSQQVASPLAAVGPQASEVLARTFRVASARRVTVAGLAVTTAAPGTALEQLARSLADSHAAVPSLSATFRLDCGQGPVLSLDGHDYQTAVTGTLADVVSRLPVTVSLCTRGGQLFLGAGQHWLTVAPSSAFVVTDLDMRTAPASGASPASASGSGGQRSARVLSWADDDRSVRVEPGPRSYLEVHENFDSGWQATLNGRPLTAVELDGWQQAFLVPAGQGGLVKLKFTPTTVYHGALVAAAAALVLLVLTAIVPAALLPARRRGRRRARRRDRRAAVRGAPQRRRNARAERPQDAGATEQEPWQPQPWTPQPWGASDAPGPAGPRQAAPPVGAGGAGSHPAAGPDPATGAKPGGWLRRAARRPAVRGVAALVPLAALIGIAGGPVLIVVPVLACLAYWRPRWLPWLALGAMAAAGVVAATGHPSVMGSGAFSGLAQACALTALAATLIPSAAPVAPASTSPRPAGQRGEAS
jgi:arabinofuranan 3-O-arabinosyltransferase